MHCLPIAYFTYYFFFERCIPLLYISNQIQYLFWMFIQGNCSASHSGTECTVICTTDRTFHGIYWWSSHTLEPWIQISTVNGQSPNKFHICVVRLRSFMIDSAVRLHGEVDRGGIIAHLEVADIQKPELISWIILLFISIQSKYFSFIIYPFECVANMISCHHRDSWCLSKEKCQHVIIAV